MATWTTWHDRTGEKGLLLVFTLGNSSFSAADPNFTYILIHMVIILISIGHTTTHKGQAKLD
jgi:hypothetical protein